MVAVGGLGASGCAVGSPDGDPGAATTATADSEEARIQDFLDRRYTAADVRHSYRTNAGDVVDCIDFAAQVGVRALAARGEQARTDIPPRFAAKLDEMRARASSQGVQRDEEGHARACPEGTVPEIRITADRIRTIGLDRYLHAVTHKAPPPRNMPPGMETQGFAHVQATFGPVANDGGVAYLAVASPGGLTGDDHSIAQTWTSSNSSSDPPQELQTVEAGWIASPGLLGDTKPRAFIFATADGYNTTGCYNNNPSLAEGNGLFVTCLPWVMQSGSMALGQALDASVVGGAQIQMYVETYFDSSAGWYIFVSGSVGGVDEGFIGYYPRSDYEWSDSPLTTGASYFQAGAEVYDETQDSSTATWPAPPAVQMGEGPIGATVEIAGDVGYHWNAFANGYGYYDKSYTFKTAGAKLENTRPTAYAQSNSFPKGQSSWGNYFYYGDVDPFVFHL